MKMLAMMDAVILMVISLAKETIMYAFVIRCAFSMATAAVIYMK